MRRNGRILSALTTSRRKEKNGMAEDSGPAAGELGAGPVEKTPHNGNVWTVALGMILLHTHCLIGEVYGGHFLIAKKPKTYYFLIV